MTNSPPSPAMLANAPLLDQWYTWGQRTAYLGGTVSHHPDHEDGTIWLTPAVVALDATVGWAQLHTGIVVRLGAPDHRTTSGCRYYTITHGAERASTIARTVLAAPRSLPAR